MQSDKLKYSDIVTDISRRYTLKTRVVVYRHRETVSSSLRWDGGEGWGTITPDYRFIKLKIICSKLLREMYAD